MGKRKAADYEAGNSQITYRQRQAVFSYAPTNKLKNLR